MARSARASSPPERLLYEPDLVSEAEERDLTAALEALPFGEVRMHGVVAKRRAVHFGWDYGYASWSAIRRTDPIPAFLEPARERLARLAALDPRALVAVLIARYPPGAGIGWHRDAPMFGPTVVGLSLGGAARMRFRRDLPGGGREAWDQPLAPRSGYVLAGEARARWQHSIPAVDALRFAITFRTVKDEAKWDRLAYGRSPW